MYYESELEFEFEYGHNDCHGAPPVFNIPPPPRFVENQNMDCAAINDFEFCDSKLIMETNYGNLSLQISAMILLGCVLLLIFVFVSSIFVWKHKKKSKKSHHFMLHMHKSKSKIDGNFNMNSASNSQHFNQNSNLHMEMQLSINVEMQQMKSFHYSSEYPIARSSPYFICSSPGPDPYQSCDNIYEELEEHQNININQFTTNCDRQFFSEFAEDDSSLPEDQSLNKSSSENTTVATIYEHGTGSTSSNNADDSVNYFLQKCRNTDKNSSSRISNDYFQHSILENNFDSDYFRFRLARSNRINKIKNNYKERTKSLNSSRRIGQKFNDKISSYGSGSNNNTGSSSTSNIDSINLNTAPQNNNDQANNNLDRKNNSLNVETERRNCINSQLSADENTIPSRNVKYNSLNSGGANIYFTRTNDLHTPQLQHIKTGFQLNFDETNNQKLKLASQTNSLLNINNMRKIDRENFINNNMQENCYQNSATGDKFIKPSESSKNLINCNKPATLAYKERCVLSNFISFNDNLNNPHHKSYDSAVNSAHSSDSDYCQNYGEYSCNKNIQIKEENESPQTFEASSNT